MQQLNIKILTADYWFNLLKAEAAKNTNLWWLINWEIFTNFTPYKKENVSQSYIRNVGEVDSCQVREWGMTTT